jgi:hypothetical protein
MWFLSLFRLPVCTVLALAGVGGAIAPALAQSLPTFGEDATLATRSAIAHPLLQLYQDAENRFEIALPPGYTATPTPNGMMFTSADGTFGGLVDVGSAQGQWFSLVQLESALKTEYEQRLSAVTWQGSYEHTQGGVRIDWAGQDALGNRLDAISFIQQQGNRIFVLSMWGVNAPYSSYNDDADLIFATYHIQP